MPKDQKFIYAPPSPEPISAEQIRLSRERLLVALRSAAIGVWEMDPETGETTWDQGMADLLGIPAERRDIESARWTDFIHPEDRKSVIAALDSAGQQELPWSKDFRVVRADGMIRWFNSRGVVVKLADDRRKMVGVDQDITERKSAEEALRQSELQYREMYQEMLALFGAMTDLVFIFDSEGRYLKIVDTSPALLYKPSDELLGKTLHEVFPKDQADFFLSRLTQALSLKRSLSFEYILPIKEKEYWFTATASPISDERVLLVARDITDRKKAENALRATNEQLQKVLAIETVGVVYWDLATGCLVDANETFLDMMGYKRSDIETRKLTWQTFTPPEYYELSLSEVSKFHATGRVGPYEKEYFRKDGTRRWLLFAGSSLGGNQSVEFCVDISDRKQAEHALRASEQRYRSLFESIDEAFCIIEVLFDSNKPIDYRFLETNPSFTKHTGLRDAVGKRMRALEPNIEEYWFEIYGRIALTGKPERFTNKAKHLQNRWYDVYAFRVGLPEERKVAVLFNDISERKQAEEALVRLNETLEQKVQERTAIAEARAIQLRSLAVELIETEERERRSFARLLHDDLQQMLAAAKMQLQSLSDSMPNELALVDIHLLLKESIEKSRRLSHELSPPILQHTGLIGVLQWLGLRMGEQFNLKVKLEVVTEPRVENSTLKRFLFRSVQELLFNTVKHSGVNRACIILSGSEREIKISVSDEGRGFEPDRLSDLTAGFGLMTIRERANYIGGSLEIASAPGKGSHFTITVPADPEISVETSPEIHTPLEPHSSTGPSASHP